MNPGSEVITVILRKDDQNQSWGFRMQGGSDFSTPLSVQSVSPGGVADNCGLCAGDAVMKINDRVAAELEHEEAKRMILMAGSQVTMVVQRGAVSVWRPKVTPMSQLKPGEVRLPSEGVADEEPYVQRTSLAANKQEFKPIGTGYNRAAKPFAGFGSSAPAGAPPAPVAPSPQYNSAYPSAGQQQQADYSSAAGQQQQAAYSSAAGQQQQAAYSSAGQQQQTAYSSTGQQQQASQSYMPDIGGLHLDSDSHKQNPAAKTEQQPLSNNLQPSAFKITTNMADTNQEPKTFSPTMIAIQAVESQKDPEKRHRPVSPRYAALDTVADEQMSDISDNVKSHLSAPSGGQREVRSVSPTLMFIQQEEAAQKREKEMALKGAQTSSTMLDQKEGEEVRYHGYMDHSKQSRSFKMLQSEVEDGGSNAAPPAAPMPSGIRSVRAPTTKPPGERSENSQYMTCAVCGRLIVGVFVKVSGDPMCPGCYKCVVCGKNLKNQGYFKIDGKLHCDGKNCAQSAAQPPSADMYAQPVYR